MCLSWDCCGSCSQYGVNTGRAWQTMLSVFNVKFITIPHHQQGHVEDHLNRLKPLAENTIAEEQAGFRHGRSAIEHIFNL